MASNRAAKALVPLVRRSVTASRSSSGMMRGGMSPPMPAHARIPAPTENVSSKNNSSSSSNKSRVIDVIAFLVACIIIIVIRSPTPDGNVGQMQGWVAPSRVAESNPCRPRRRRFLEEIVPSDRMKTHSIIPVDGYRFVDFSFEHNEFALREIRSSIVWRSLDLHQKKSLSLTPFIDPSFFFYRNDFATERSRRFGNTTSCKLPVFPLANRIR